MLKIQTKLTSQGQVSIPAAVRHLLGLTPGSTVEWVQEGSTIVVKRAVHSSSADVHRALFPPGQPVAAAKTLADLKKGVAQHMLQKHGKAHAGD